MYLFSTLLLPELTNVDYIQAMFATAPQSQEYLRIWAGPKALPIHGQTRCHAFVPLAPLQKKLCRTTLSVQLPVIAYYATAYSDFSNRIGLNSTDRVQQRSAHMPSPPYCLRSWVELMSYRHKTRHGGETAERGDAASMCTRPCVFH